MKRRPVGEGVCEDFALQNLQCVLRGYVAVAVDVAKTQAAKKRNFVVLGLMTSLRGRRFV